VDERTRLTHTCSERWLLKANGYNQDLLDSAFDKFFTLFVAFNILYSHAANELGRDPLKDKNKATLDFPQWAGHERIWTALNNGSEASDDLLKLRHLIRRDGPFFLFWKRGEFGELRRDEAKTAELCEKLGSVLPRDAVEAVLEYLYLVRCNIFHGSKALEEPQREILTPSIRCLERSIKLGMERLMEENQLSVPP
jgi:hypothetical protein